MASVAGVKRVASLVERREERWLELGLAVEGERVLRSHPQSPGWLADTLELGKVTGSAGFIRAFCASEDQMEKACESRWIRSGTGIDHIAAQPMEHLPQRQKREKKWPSHVKSSAFVAASAYQSRRC